MRRKAQRLTALILGSSREFGHKSYTDAVIGFLRKTHRIYVKTARRSPKNAEDFLNLALACYRCRDTERAMETFEAGLNEHPAAESLLASYFRICCEQERLVRVIDFINPTKKQLCQTLARLPICDSAPGHQLVDDGQKHDVIWLTEDIISRNFDDVLKLWRLADLLEHAGKAEIANKIHQRLARRAPNDPEDYLYGGISEIRLGNIEAGFDRLELGLMAHPGHEYIRSVYRDCCYIHLSFERYLKLNDIFAEEAAGEPWSALNFYRNALKRHPPEAFAFKLKEVEINCGPANFLLLVDEFFAHLWGNIASFDKARLHSFLVRLSDLDAGLSARMFLEAVNRFQTDDAPWLTDEFIKHNSDDALKLWRLADLLEHAGKVEIANKIHRILSKRVPSKPEEYLYGGVSDMRLGHVDAGFEKLKLGLAAHPESEAITSVYKDCCYAHVAFDRHRRLSGLSGNEVSEPGSALDFYRKAFKMAPPELCLLKFKDASLNCAPDDLLVLQGDFLAHLGGNKVPLNSARLSIVFSRLLDLDVDFAEQVFLIFYSMDWGSDDSAKKYLLALINKLTLPIVRGSASDPEEITTQFIADVQAFAQNSMELSEPISDFGGEFIVWQSLFCMVEPLLYSRAMAAFELLAFKLWPKLDYTAPHIDHPLASQDEPGRKIRIGFTALDSMPMMSGLMERLEKVVFETVYLRPGKEGNSQTANDWISRAGRTVEYSNADAYSAMNTIAGQKLDILISGPSGPQIFFPLMARLAHLQMVLLEPNWPDGMKNSDYYISWQIAEPENHRDSYKTPVALLRSPPYWIERSPLGEAATMRDDATEDIRQRLLGLGPKDRFYICANTHPKIHPIMDEMLSKLLEADPAGSLVFLRGDAATANTLKLRLKEKLGRHYERALFVNTLEMNDAHSLLISADCCLDSYPICGMSSSFDGITLGVPIVTLPADIPFGRWTAAIYEYLGVADLTAKDVDEYIRIAMRLAMDKDWRRQKSAEIREKSSRYIESTESFDEFQHFILQAWRRKQAGLPPGNWVAGKWQ